MSLFGNDPQQRSRSTGRHLALDTRESQTFTTTAADARLRLPGPAQRAMVQRPRHAGIFEAVHRLDMQLDAADRQQLVEWIREQYVTEYGDLPIGFLAKCYLGPPYVDHRLDLVHSIVEHFTGSDSVPSPFDRARSLARHAAYDFVEVYASGQLIAVRQDGVTEIVPGGN